MIQAIYNFCVHVSSYFEYKMGLKIVQPYQRHTILLLLMLLALPVSQV